MSSISLLIAVLLPHSDPKLGLNSATAEANDCDAHVSVCVRTNTGAYVGKPVWILRVAEKLTGVGF